MLSKLDIKGAESALFFRHWLRHPLEIGAFLPSSAAVGRAMAKAVAFDRPGMVLELGGGTGAVTASLLDTGCAPDRLIVVEREPALAATLRRRFKKLEIVQAIGIAARRWCLKHELHFTTAYHTRFPEYLAVRYIAPKRFTYALLRRFHAPAVRVMVATESVPASLPAMASPISRRGVGASIHRFSIRNCVTSGRNSSVRFSFMSAVSRMRRIFQRSSGSTCRDRKSWSAKARRLRP